MEKLIVKNFGPIKEAEIDLTKYVIFIGDTSTGKSVLAKLVTIFRDSVYRFSTDINSMDFRRELVHYNINFDYGNTEIEYFLGDYSSSLKNGKISSNKTIFTDDTRIEMFKDIEEILSKHTQRNSIDIESIVDNIFLKLQDAVITTYIPAERILNTFITSSISGLWANNVALPECFKDFAARYEVARKEIKNIDYEELGIQYIFKEGLDHVKYKDIELPANQLSSGIQSLLPLLIIIEYALTMDDYSQFRKNILIEEPELNLFPAKQKILVEHIINKLSKSDFRLIATTHSPYILSVLDTLILAKNTFNEHPDIKDEINSIISEDKWIDYNDISVYEVRNDGTIKSLKNEEFKSIDVNAIDRVSDIISEEFDKLTELRYAQ